jgi:hypothetical protein
VKILLKHKNEWKRPRKEFQLQQRKRKDWKRW